MSAARRRWTRSRFEEYGNNFEVELELEFGPGWRELFPREARLLERRER